MLLCKFDWRVLTFGYPETSTVLWSDLFACLVYLRIISGLYKARKWALAKGDENAAIAVILPIYLPILCTGTVESFLRCLMVIMSGKLCNSSYIDRFPSRMQKNPFNNLLYAVYILSFEVFVNSLSFLFFERSVSNSAQSNSVSKGFLISCLTTVLFVLSLNNPFSRESFWLFITYQSVLYVVAILIPLLVVLLPLLLKGLSKKSKGSPRYAAYKYFIIYSFSWRVIFIVHEVVQWAVYLYTGGNSDVSTSDFSDYLQVLLYFFRDTLLPFFVYVTLHYDTHYWRGLPQRREIERIAEKIKQRKRQESLRSPITDEAMIPDNGRDSLHEALLSSASHLESVDQWLAQPRYPPGDTANLHLQSMLDKVPIQVYIDFAFLSIDYENIIGRGATASVFAGTLTLKDVSDTADTLAEMDNNSSAETLDGAISSGYNIETNSVVSRKDIDDQVEQQWKTRDEHSSNDNATVNENERRLDSENNDEELYKNIVNDEEKRSETLSLSETAYDLERNDNDTNNDEEKSKPKGKISMLFSEWKNQIFKRHDSAGGISIDSKESSLHGNGKSQLTREQSQISIDIFGGWVGRRIGQLLTGGKTYTRPTPLDVDELNISNKINGEVHDALDVDTSVLTPRSSTKVIEHFQDYLQDELSVDANSHNNQRDHEDYSAKKSPISLEENNKNLVDEGISYEENNTKNLGVATKTSTASAIEGDLENKFTCDDGRELISTNTNGNGLLIDFARRNTSRNKIPVAVKMYTPPELDIATIDAFAKETELLPKLRHRNIVPYFGLCVAPPYLCLVSALCTGGSLQERIDSSVEWSFRQRIDIAKDCARAVAYLHEMGCIHRDIKPDNFILGKNNTCMLTDFGACVRLPMNTERRIVNRKFSQELDKVVGSRHRRVGSGAQIQMLKRDINDLNDEGDTGFENYSEEAAGFDEKEEGNFAEYMGIYHDRDLVGTVDHMSPELLDCDNRRMHIPYSYASDVYALAVVISSTLSMQPPFQGLGGFKVRNMVLQGHRPALPMCPPEIREILLHCYSKHPQMRPTAQTVLQALEKVDINMGGHHFEQR